MSIDISESKNNLVRPAPNPVDALPSLRAVSSTLRDGVEPEAGLQTYGLETGSQRMRYYCGECFGH